MRRPVLAVRTPWPASRTAAALLGFTAAWVLTFFLVRYGFYRDVSEDQHFFRDWARQMLAGAMPYRDFPMPYPPLSLPAFVLPGLFSDAARRRGSYELGFVIEMLACGLAVVWLVIDACRSLAFSEGRLRAIAALLLVTPLLMGPLIISRYDLWPAALTAAALAALLRRHDRIALALLALGATAKVYPLVLAPVFLIHIWRRAGRQSALLAAAAGVVTGAVVLAPFLLLAPSGTIAAIRFAFDRPPEVESLGANLLIVGHSLFGIPVVHVQSFGSDNIVGATAADLALVQSIALVVGLAALWLWYARRPRDMADDVSLVTVSAASVGLYVALGKVLSDQYLIWLIPLVLIVPGRRGAVAIALLAVATVMTSLFYPQWWAAYTSASDLGVSLFALARVLLLLVLAIVLAVPSTFPQRWRERHTTQTPGSP